MKTWYSILRQAVLLLPALMLFSACIYDPADPEGGNVGVGDALPEFSVTLSDGSSVSTGSLLGEVSLIMFFSTECPDCQEVLPIVQSIYDEYGSQLRFVLISREEGAESIYAYWLEHSLSMPYSAQSNREIYRLFATSGIPRIYISDRTLTVRSAFSDSPLPSLSTLRSALEALL